MKRYVLRWRPRKYEFGGVVQCYAKSSRDKNEWQRVIAESLISAERLWADKRYFKPWFFAVARAGSVSTKVRLLRERFAPSGCTSGDRSQRWRLPVVFCADRAPSVRSRSLEFRGKKMTEAMLARCLSANEANVIWKEVWAKIHPTWASRKYNKTRTGKHLADLSTAIIAAEP